MQFNDILKLAVERGASDVHLKVGLPPIIRVRKKLMPLKEAANKAIDAGFNKSVEQLLKPHMIKRLAKEKSIDITYHMKNFGRFRINICYERSNVRLTARVLAEYIPSVKELQLPEFIERLALGEQEGLILVTGPTGVGKTSTLFAMLNHINTHTNKHILTIEDPIEYIINERHSLVTQMEIGSDANNFAQALRSSLRSDPDVVLVGEMRDPETVVTALNAAETGHLVLSTLHTTGTLDTITRVLSSIERQEQEVPRSQLAHSLKGIISQKLLPSQDGTELVPAIEFLDCRSLYVQKLILDPKLTHKITDVLSEGPGTKSQETRSFNHSLVELVRKGKVDYKTAQEYAPNAHDFKWLYEQTIAGRKKQSTTKFKRSQDTHLTLKKA